ncbi:MAG: hypothetical protein EOO29_15420 [Comamonadaceae bacterium]|nr:MAG: hypothetical protein EOO29_15420 [Comamonadaceae bacterium]
MNRCPTRSPISLPSCLLSSLGCATALALLLVSAAHLPAQAQVSTQVQTQNELTQVGGRTFPVGTLRGKMAFGAFPEVELDGRAERLAPGARIRNTQNLGVVPASVVGQYLAVNYRRDAAGLVNDVWVLTPEEAGTERASANGTPFLNFWPFTSRADNEVR